jgi:polyisoprenoid-binding protein YceI
MTSTTPDVTSVDLSSLTGEYTFDVNHSRLGFVARHAMITKVRGSFNEFTGTTTIDGDHPENSHVELTIDVKSIDTRNSMRDDHLRTNDFFDMATYPTISFRSTKITPVGGNDYEVTGELTIKDVTRTVTLPLEFTGAATDPFGNQRIGFEGSLTLNRSDYGITYNAALEAGGVLVSEKITVEVEISAIKNA